MSYTQLTSEDRYTFSALRKQGLSMVDIAVELGRHKSTLYRELKRNSNTDDHVDQSYRTDRAIQDARARRSFYHAPTPILPMPTTNQLESSFVKNGVRNKCRTSSQSASYDRCPTKQSTNTFGSTRQTVATYGPTCANLRNNVENATTAISRFCHLLISYVVLRFW